MRRSDSTLAVVCATLVMLAACSDGGVEPVETRAELSQLLAQATASGAPAGLITGLPLLGAPAGCAYAAATQSFACPPQSVAGVAVTRSYQLLDASGTPQSAYSATTVSVRVSTSFSGTLTPPAVPGLPNGATFAPATIERHETVTLTGLGASSQRTLNGTSTSTVTTTLTFQGDSFTMQLAGADTISNLVLPANPGTQAQPNFPVSGSVINNQSVTTGTAPLSVTQRMRIVTTFNGTSTVAIAMTVNGQTTTCNVNLLTGPPVCT